MPEQDTAKLSKIAAERSIGIKADGYSSDTKKKKRSDAAYDLLSGQDKVRVKASGLGKTEGTKALAGAPGVYTTERPGRDVGVFSFGKGNIKKDRRK